RVSASLDGCSHHGADSMDGEETYRSFGYLRHGSLHGFADIVELEVEKDLLAFGDELADEVHAGGAVKLHADLVEIDLGTDSAHKAARFFGRLHVESYDDGGHRRRMDLALRPVT